MSQHLATESWRLICSNCLETDRIEWDTVMHCVCGFAVKLEPHESAEERWLQCPICGEKYPGDGPDHKLRQYCTACGYVYVGADTGADAAYDEFMESA